MSDYATKAELNQLANDIKNNNKLLAELLISIKHTNVINETEESVDINNETEETVDINNETKESVDNNTANNTTTADTQMVENKYVLHTPQNIADNQYDKSYLLYTKNISVPLAKKIYGKDITNVRRTLKSFDISSMQIRTLIDIHFRFKINPKNLETFFITLPTEFKVIAENFLHLKYIKPEYEHEYDSDDDDDITEPDYLTPDSYGPWPTNQKYYYCILSKKTVESCILPLFAENLCNDWEHRFLSVMKGRTGCVKGLSDNRIIVVYFDYKNCETIPYQEYIDHMVELLEPITLVYHHDEFKAKMGITKMAFIKKYLPLIGKSIKLNNDVLDLIIT